MATQKSTTTGKLPEGFVSPFTRVAMEPNARIDDGLACIATLTGQTLENIKQHAYKLGLNEHGPAWVYGPMLQKLADHFGLTLSDYKEVPKLDALPDVAILTVDFNPATDFGRQVVWHHVRATPQQPSHHYIVDPAYWLDEARHVTADFSHLKFASPLYFMEVTVKSPPKPASKPVAKSKARK